MDKNNLGYGTIQMWYYLGKVKLVQMRFLPWH